MFRITRPVARDRIISTLDVEAAAELLFDILRAGQRHRDGSGVAARAACPPAE